MNTTAEQAVNHKRKDRLPIEAVEFVRKFLEMGVPPAFFNSIKLCGDLYFALALGKIRSLVTAYPTFRSLDNVWTPLALNWSLPEAEAEYISLGRRLVGNDPCQAPRLGQLQPKLLPTLASIVEMKSAKNGLQFLREILNYKIQASESAVPYLFQKGIGLGLAHAKIIIEIFRKHSALHRAMGGRSLLNLPLFILLQYHIFTDYRDEHGHPTYAWLEVSNADEELHGDQQIIRAQLHTDLRTLIPQGALVAVANVPWFEK